MKVIIPLGRMKVIIPLPSVGSEPYHDIRFSLMAVVADKRIAYEEKLSTLRMNRMIVYDAIKQIFLDRKAQEAGEC